MEITSIFTQILYMGGVASVVIPAVLLVRILMRRFPRKYAYFLWLIVGIRLVCPVAIPSSLSVFNLFVMQERDAVLVEPQEKNFVTTQPGAKNSVSAELPQETVTDPSGESHESGSGLSAQGEQEDISGGTVADQSGDTVEHVAELPALTAAGNDQIRSGGEERTAGDSGQTDTRLPVVWWLLPAASYLWLAGMVIRLLWNTYLMVRMKKRLERAVLYNGNVYECDGIASPFVFGLFRPRIYIPFRLGEKERIFILQHERYHVRRKDHITKLAAFLILTVYWFHPLVWAAYFCMIRDMEMSCDEHVLAAMGEEAREEYSRTLLAFAVNRRRPPSGLPAFGETDPERRIRHILDFHKRRKWVGILAGILVLAAALVCLTSERTAQVKESRTEISATGINGYETRLLLESGRKIEEEASPYHGMYGGRFVLATYRDGKKCDERVLDAWDHTPDGQEMLYFPEKLSFCIRDYDGDGKEDDFALGQRTDGSRTGEGTAMAYSFYTVEENGSIMKYNVQEDDVLPEEYPDEITVDKWGEYSPEFLVEEDGIVYHSPERSVEGLETQHAKLGKRVDEERMPESELSVFRDIENCLREIYPQQLVEEMQNGSRMVTWEEGVENYHIVCGGGGKETVVVQIGFKEGKLDSYFLRMGEEFEKKLPRVMRELEESDPDGISRWMKDVTGDLHEPVKKFAEAVCGRTVEEKELRSYAKYDMSSSIYGSGEYMTFADMQGGIYTVNKVYGTVEIYEESGLVGLGSDDPALEEMEDRVKIGIWMPEDGTYEPTYFTGGDDMGRLQTLAEELDPEYGCTKELEEKLEKEKAEGYVLSYKGNTWAVYSRAGCVAFMYGKDERENPQKNAVMYLPELCEWADYICSVQLPYGSREPSQIRNLVSAELSYRKKDGTYVRQTLKKKSSLQTLEDILSGAKVMEGASACPFGEAVLTVELQDGRKIPVTWANDSCRVIRIDGRYYEYEDRHLSFSPNGIRALFDKIPWR